MSSFLFSAFKAGMLGDNLVQKINTWQKSQNYIHAGGVEQASFGDFSDATQGATWIDPVNGIRQNGIIDRIVCRAGAISWSNVTIKFKIFRYNSTTGLYDMVSESSQAVSAGSKEVVTVTLATPLSVSIGDLIGYWCETRSIRAFLSSGTLRSAVGNVITSNAFETISSLRLLDIDILMTPPYLAVTGDSIPEGHLATNHVDNHSGLHTTAYNGTTVFTVPRFIASAEIMAQLRALIGDGNVLKYQNLALGSQTYSWVASTGAPACQTVTPAVVIVHCGINDLSTGRTWEQVVENLNTIRSTITSARLLVSEILPWNAGNDTQAALIRTWNANLAAWCAANNSRIILCHDEMAQIRPSTGMLDNMLDAYNQDNIHPNEAGAVALAKIWMRYL